MHGLFPERIELDLVKHFECLLLFFFHVVLGIDIDASELDCCVGNAILGLFDISGRRGCCSVRWKGHWDFFSVDFVDLELLIVLDGAVSTDITSDTNILRPLGDVLPEVFVPGGAAATTTVFTSIAATSTMIIVVAASSAHLMPVFILIPCSEELEHSVIVA